MALTERSRSAIYLGLCRIIEDEDAVGELLSYFPSRDEDGPASKEFVRAEMADLRAEMANLRAEMHAGFQSSLRWTIGMMITLSGLIVASNAAMR